MDTFSDGLTIARAGDEAEVESALQEMLDKIQKLETVASEDLEAEQLRGTIEEKIEKEGELRRTLETLEQVATQIEDVSSVKDLKTIDDMAELLQDINDKIEDSVAAEAGKSKFGVKSSLHLNGIVDMIKSLEKVTGDLKHMQDNIDDYFDEENDNEEAPEKPSDADTNSTSTERQQLDRRGKQLELEASGDAEDYEDFASSGAEAVAEEVRGGGGGEEEDCEAAEARSRVRVCTPQVASVEDTVTLYSSLPEDVRHCYDV